MKWIKRRHFSYTSNIRLEERNDLSILSDVQVSDYVENDIDDEEDPETDSESKQLLGDAVCVHVLL